jgi:hypothetical protein
MAHGTSGRIVIDLDPEFKQELYDTLRQKGLNMREWFLSEAQRLCDEHQQPKLSFTAHSVPARRTSSQATRP